LPYNSLLFNSVVAAIFIFLSFTDFFDGYLARRFGKEIRAARLLNPIADKFLVSSVLISLLAINKIFFYWVVVLIGRTIFMMGARIVALEKGFPIPVTFWGKINTLVQMIYVAFVIVNPYQAAGFTTGWNLTEHALLVIVLLLSVFSVKKYIDEFVIQVMMRDKDDIQKDDLDDEPKIYQEPPF